MDRDSESKEKESSLKSFLSFRRPMTFRVKLPDCIKPSKSTPLCWSFVELYSGSEERWLAETGKGGRGGEDRPLI